MAFLPSMAVGGSNILHRLSMSATGSEHAHRYPVDAAGNWLESQEALSDSGLTN